MSQPTTEPRAAADGGALTLQKLQRLAAGFGTGPAHRLAQNAVTQNTIDDVALNRSIVTGIDHTFSHLLDDWTVTNQKKSGRCWLFAGLNLLRVGLMKKMNLKEFEFSQNHALFFDKLERANYFLEAVIETADRPVDDRTVAFLLDRPLDDGGQWNMFVNVVRKHGLVPKAFMPETESSSNTRQMNAILLAKLREGARTLRELRGGGAPMEAARAAKDEILAVIHRILCIHLGTPPQRFPWQWNDKDKEFHRDGDLTPQEFAQKYVELPLDEYVCLVNDPRESSPYGRTFTVQHLGNVVDGEIVKYLNVEMDLMKDVAMRAIMGGEPVWFGCDVGKMMRRDMGIWDAGLYDYESVYDTTFELGKAGRLLYHQTLMTHAMLFTGVDVVDDRPRRWRVENSWGDENGRKGFFTMNDSWFEQHMFEIAAVLPPWDPMGSLAG
ncbi:MAG: C1 family peptidase [Planctomycetota bacterium]